MTCIIITWFDHEQNASVPKPVQAGFTRDASCADDSVSIQISKAVVAIASVGVRQHGIFIGGHILLSAASTSPNRQNFAAGAEYSGAFLRRK